MNFKIALRVLCTKTGEGEKNQGVCGSEARPAASPSLEKGAQEGHGEGFAGLEFLI